MRSAGQAFVTRYAPRVLAEQWLGCRIFGASMISGVKEHDRHGAQKTVMRSLVRDMAQLVSSTNPLAGGHARVCLHDKCLKAVLNVADLTATEQGKTHWKEIRMRTGEVGL